MKLEELSKEQLLEEIKKLKKRKKFGLVWENKPENVVEKCKIDIPVLNEITEKGIISNSDDAYNFLIEGDNYHSLSVLNYTHQSKIDVIYIDPPYNIGNGDFIYNDNYVDKEDTFRHSKWVSFMNTRLLLAYQLLKEDGVIFISIDDNEVAQLKLLCDQIFKEENFISLLNIETGEVFGTKAAHVDKTFVKVKDYVLVYAKSKCLIKDKQPLYDSMRELYDSHYNTIIDESLQRKSFLLYLKENEWAKNLFDTNSLEINSKNVNMLMNYNDEFRDWVYKEVAERLYADAPYSRAVDSDVLEKYRPGEPFLYEDKLLFQTSTGSIRMFLNFKESLRLSDDYIPVYGRCSIRGDLWKGFHFDMRNVQDEGMMDFKNGKKPTRLVKQLCKWFNKKDAIVLDFFAGSGTTGQAVMELNFEDSGERRFVLCTNNENNIAEEKCYPRLKNVIKKYPSNLKYFKTDFVPKNKVSDDTRTELVKKSTEMICVKEGTFQEVFSSDKYKIFKDAFHSTAILFDLDFLKELKEKINDLKLSSSIYVFSLSNDTYNSDFEDLEVEHELCSIPESILEVYRKLFKE